MENRHTTAHIIWDWNGTLLHDVDVALEATNACFQELALPQISLDQYRELYCVPIPRFYQRLLGRAPTTSEWDVFNTTFHQHYFSRAERASLTEGCAQLLSGWAVGGGTQSVCSLAPHQRLLSWVSDHGIDRHFVRVDGSVDGNGPARGKTGQLSAHVRALASTDPRRTVMIGDAVDDARAAAAAGVHAVLYAGGTQSRRILEDAALPGVPVVDSLAEAVQQAELLTG